MAKKKTLAEAIAGEEDATEVAEVTAEEQEVLDAKAALDQAKSELDDAQTNYDEALASHQAAVAAMLPPKVEADPAKHILIEQAHGVHSLLEHPEAKDKPSRLNIGGQNYEHVADGENGCWVYRRM